jgi:DNA polymerase-3 subunit delta
VAGVTAIVGDKGFDSFLAEEALEAVLAKAVGAERAEAVQVLRGDETNWNRVLDAARMGSLFATRRAVVVRGADALKGDADGLDGYLGDPTPGVALILVASKPDKRRTAWKRVFEKARIVKAEPLKGAALRARVAAEIRRRPLAISDEGVEELLERVGQELRRLIGELEKLEAFGLQGGRPLSAEDVAAVLGRGLAQPLFKLGDAIMARRPAEALELAEGLLEDGEDAVKLLGTLHRSLRQVRGALALRLARASREEMVGRLKLPPNMAFKLQGIADASKLWSEAELASALRALAVADRRIKTGADPRVALAAAVVSACGGGEARTSPRPGR